MQINFSGDLRRRMSEKCLHCAQRSAYGIEQSRVCMSQPVPICASQSKLLTGRLELSIDEIVPVVSCSPIRAEHQSVRIHCSWLASRENLDRLCPQGNRPPAARTLGLIGNTFINRLSHTQHTMLQINVPPAKCQQICSPLRKGSVNVGHGGFLS